MLDTILIILLCIILLGSIGDFFFDALGFTARVILSIVLILASAYLVIKLFFAMIPWMFVISLIALVVGIVWLIRAIIRRV